jgi:hypothetical protein
MDLQGKDNRCGDQVDIIESTTETPVDARQGCKAKGNPEAGDHQRKKQIIGTIESVHHDGLPGSEGMSVVRSLPQSSPVSRAGTRPVGVEAYAR